MADYLPKYLEGDSLTFIAGTGGVTGGLLVNVAGAVATAGDCVVGVAGQDAAVGAPCTVWRDGVHRLRTAAAVTAGQPLKAAAAGTVVPYVSTDAANLYIGDAWTDAASGALVDAILRF